MGNSQSYYVTSVSWGLVLAHSPDGRPTGVVAQQANDSDNQKWVVENGLGDDVALRCVANGQYLRANGGVNGSTVGTGEKQWWKVSKENVTPPHACRLSPVDYPNVFLNHYQGRHVPKGHPGMNVHMWQWEQPNEWCLTWYFLDTSGNFKPRADDAAVASGNKDQPAGLEDKMKELEAREAAKLEELQAREAALAKRDEEIKAREMKAEDIGKQEAALKEREKDIAAVQQRLKDVEQREAALATRDQGLTKRENDLKQAEQRQTSLPNAAPNTADQEAKLKELEQREAALRQREEDISALDAKVKDIVQREERLRGREQDFATRLASSKDVEQRRAPMTNGEVDHSAYTARMADIERREAALARKELDVDAIGGTISADPNTQGAGTIQQGWVSPFDMWRSQAGAPSGHRIQMPGPRR